MIAHKFHEHDATTSDDMSFEFPTMDGDVAARKSAPRVVSASRDERRGTPVVAPLSPCPSDEGSTGAAVVVPPAICITGRFGDVEREYHVDPRRVLGTGHHGSVRECVHRRTGVRRAVKSIHKGDPAVKPAGLAREILLLKEANHENVVRLADVFEDEGYVHLVTDLYEGGELFDRIVRKSSEDNGAPCFTEEEAARIVRQLLSALCDLHARDVVHRDIKPENILFETSADDSPVRIVDFGLSRKHRAGVEAPMTSLVGTPYYIAPEVLRGRYTKSCDMWSLGVIAYVLLCGYPPFNGEDGDRTHRCVLRGKYCFPAEDWEDVSEDAVDFIRNLLRMDPRRRMTAEEALEHPWMARHAAGNATAKEERRDESPARVSRETPRKQPRLGEAPRKILGRCDRSPRGSERKVRISMFAF